MGKKEVKIQEWQLHAHTPCCAGKVQPPGLLSRGPRDFSSLLGGQAESWTVTGLVCFPTQGSRGNQRFIHLAQIFRCFRLGGRKSRLRCSILARSRTLTSHFKYGKKWLLVTYTPYPKTCNRKFWENSEPVWRRQETSHGERTRTEMSFRTWLTCLRTNLLSEEGTHRGQFLPRTRSLGHSGTGD